MRARLAVVLAAALLAPAALLLAAPPHPPGVPGAGASRDPRTHVAAGAVAEPAAAGAARPALAVGVRGVEDWRVAAAAGFVPDLFVSQSWVTGLSDEREIDAIVRHVTDLMWETRTDAILHFYYWGDTAHRRACFESAGACDFVGRPLSSDEWESRAAYLGARIGTLAPPHQRVVVVIETEFNNDARDLADNAAWWEREFPRRMLRVADLLQEGGGGRVATAVSVGAWDVERFPAWRELFASDRIDFVGTQTSGNHEQDDDPCPRDDYATLFASKTLAAVEALARVAPGKPIGVWDVFVSSHGAGGEADQARFFRDLAEARGRLASLGVAVVAVRTLADDPRQAGCLGEDEKHFGLFTADARRAKPAFDAWRDAFAAPRAAPGRVAGDALAFASGGRAVEDARATGGAAWLLPGGALARQTFRASAAGPHLVLACLASDSHALGDVSLNGARAWRGVVPREFTAVGASVDVAAGVDLTVVVRALGQNAVRVDSVRLVPQGSGAEALDACGRAPLATLEDAPVELRTP